jgi:hypothetical protein
LRILGDVLLDQPRDVRLVGQHAARDARSEEQADEGGDAAAEFEDEGGGGEDAVGKQRVGWAGEPLGEEGGDFPEDWSWGGRGKVGFRPPPSWLAGGFAFLIYVCAIVEFKSWRLGWGGGGERCGT